MSRSKLAQYTIVIIILLFSKGYAGRWYQLQTGLEYQQLVPSQINRWSKIHVFRIDPQYFNLELALAADQKKRVSNVKQLALAHEGIIAINGGFFTPEFKPIGLRIQNGVIRQRLKKTSWWGVFYIKDKKPYIVSQREYQHQKNIRFAVQGGPRLIINKKIPRLKPGLAARTALGITRIGKIIILATEKTPLSTSTLAYMMRAPESENGLNCVNALNLDGGSSTQIYAQIGKLYLDIRGFSDITDAVVVVPNKK